MFSPTLSTRKYFNLCVWKKCVFLFVLVWINSRSFVIISQEICCDTPDSSDFWMSEKNSRKNSFWFGVSERYIRKFVLNISFVHFLFFYKQQNNMLLLLAVDYLLFIMKCIIIYETRKLTFSQNFLYFLYWNLFIV